MRRIEFGMRHYFDSTRKHLHKELTRSAMGYLRNGLELFRKERTSIYPCIEPALGNLGVAIELMLKAFVVKNNPLLLFRDLPLELRAMFTCPDTVPKSFNWRRYDVDIRSFAFKTVELDELVSAFYVFFPDEKQALHPFFRFLSKCRNVSIHASLPSFQQYELDRTAYLALRVLDILNGCETFGYQAYQLTEKDKEFVSSFEASRAERVRKKIEQAKEKSKALELGKVWMSVEGWEAYVTSCPVCGSEGVLGGYTDLSGEQDEDEQFHPYLYFLADSFECSECGLMLEDIEELRMTGMELCYDRSSELEEWFRDSESY